MTWLFIFLGVACGAFLLWGLTAPARARSAANREEARLRKASTPELLQAVRGIIAYERWEGFTSARGILSAEEWTDELLLGKIEALFTELGIADEEQGLHGRGSHYFEFLDSGLGLIREILAGMASR